MNVPVSTLRLPPVLRDIADASSVTVALRLAQARGGTRIYVPHKTPEGHWLVELLGHEGARAVRKLYAGENIMIPLGLGGAIRNARQAARKALDEGASVAQAARAAGLTERGVYKLKRREKIPANPRQLGLFDD